MRFTLNYNLTCLSRSQVQGLVSQLTGVIVVLMIRLKTDRAGPRGEASTQLSPPELDQSIVGELVMCV